MEYYGIEMKGKFKGEILDTKPAWTSADEGRLIYVQDEKRKYLGTSSEWKVVIVNTAIITELSLEDAVTKKHNESHIAASHSDISSSGVDIDDAVTKKHANTLDHTQGTDTTLSTVTDTINMADNIFQRPEIKDYSETKTNISSAAGILTINLENGNTFATTLTENVTTFTISNPSPTGKACGFTLILTQAAAAKSVTWATSIKWEDSTVPTIDTNSAVYIFAFLTVDAGNIWYGFIAGSNMGVPA